jgi:hypothetical protein
MKNIFFTLLLLTAIAPGQVLANTFSGQAAVVKGNALGQSIDLVDTGALDSTGGSLEASLLDVGVPGLLTGQIGHATAVGMGNASRSEASVASLDLAVAGNQIGAKFLMARAIAVCTDGNPSVSGRSDIVQLIINGSAIDVGTQPNQTVPLPVGYVVINEQKPGSAGNSIDVTALHVVVPGAADLAIATAHADITCTGISTCPSDKDFVTGGGRITTSTGGKATFGVAGGIKNGGFWGHLTYIDHGTGMKVKGTGVTAYRAPDPINKPNLRHIEGNCEINGAAGTYQIDVDDEGEPGTNDTFYIQLSNGYTAGSTLAGGNIQLHVCK